MEVVQFGHPEFLPYIPLAAAAAIAVSIFWFRRRLEIVNFFGRNRGRIHSKKRTVFFLITFCLILVGTVLVASEPYISSQKEQDVFEPLLIAVALDISKSMLAPVSSRSPKENLPRQKDDMPCIPTRLQVAKQEITDFVEVLEQQQTDKIALVVFARYAYPAIPVPTDDYLLFKRRVDKELLLENVLTMAEGSNHWTGVEQTLKIFDTGSAHSKVVIIVTDGDPEAPADVLDQSRNEALEKLKQTDKLNIYIVGIGEPGSALPVPLLWLKNGCPDSEGGFIKQTADPDDVSLLLTNTDPQRLRSFANDLEGTYIHAAHGSELADALKQIVRRERVKTGVKYETVLIDLSEPLLWILLFLLGCLVIIKTP